MPNDVEFDVDKVEYRPRPRSSSGYSGPSSFGAMGNEPKMVRWLIKKGIVKSAGAGQAILIALVIINIVFTYVVIKYFI